MRPDRVGARFFFPGPTAMAAAGHERVSDAGVRAATVSCLTIDGAAPRLSHLLRERGFEVGAGYGALDDVLGEL